MTFAPPARTRPYLLLSPDPWADGLWVGVCGYCVGELAHSDPRSTRELYDDEHYACSSHPDRVATVALQVFRPGGLVNA